MALTRKMLKAMGIEDEKIEQIIEAHTETVDGLKAFKADADKLADVTAELEAVKKELATAKNDGYKGKYDVLKTEFEAYKTDVQKEKAHGAKESAYREALKAANVPERLIAKIIQTSSDTIDALELGEDGKAKDADKLADGIKTEWADFIPTVTTQGVKVETPPTNNNLDTSKMTDAEFFRYQREQKKG